MNDHFVAKMCDKTPNKNTNKYVCDLHAKYKVFAIRFNLSKIRFEMKQF